MASTFSEYDIGDPTSLRRKKFTFINQGPGAILVLESPGPVQTWLGSSQNMPLMDIPGSLRVVVPRTIDLPETPIEHGSTRQHAFHYKHVTIMILNFHPMDVMCQGDMCDALGEISAAIQIVARDRPNSRD